MADPFGHAVKVVAATVSMPVSEAARYIFDEYRTGGPENRDALVLALVGALATARLACGLVQPAAPVKAAS